MLLAGKRTECLEVLFVMLSELLFFWHIPKKFNRAAHNLYAKLSFDFVIVNDFEWFDDPE